MLACGATVLSWDMTRNHTWWDDLPSHHVRCVQRLAPLLPALDWGGVRFDPDWMQERERAALESAKRSAQAQVLAVVHQSIK